MLARQPTAGQSPPRRPRLSSLVRAFRTGSLSRSPPNAPFRSADPDEPRRRGLAGFSATSDRPVGDERAAARSRRSDPVRCEAGLGDRADDADSDILDVRLLGLLARRERRTDHDGRDHATSPGGVSCWRGHATAARSGGVRASSSRDHHSGAGRRCGGRGRDAGDTGHHRAGVPGAGVDHHGGSDPRLVDPARRVACGGVGCGVPDGVRDHGRAAGRRGRRDRSAGHPDAAVFRSDPAGTQRPAIPAGRDRGDPGRYPVGVRQHQPQSDHFLRGKPAVQYLRRLLLRAVHAGRGDLPRGGRHDVRRPEGEVGRGS